MGFELKTDYFNAYYEDGQYVLDSPQHMGNETKEMIMQLLYSVNNQSLNYCDWDNYKQVLENNFFFLHMEDCILLFKMRAYKKAPFFLNEIEGLVFQKESYRTVWYLLDKIIVFLFSEAFYDLQGNLLLNEEFLEENERKNGHLFYKNITMGRLMEAIRKTMKPYSFAYTCWKLNAEGMRVFENGMKLPVNTKEKRLKKEPMINAVLLNDESHNYATGVQLYYRLPSMKEIQKMDNFMEESKKIVKQKMAGEVFWHLIKNQVSVPVTFVERGKKSSLESLKEALKSL